MNYDILVLGGGIGGYVAAIRAAKGGAKVALVEKEYIGGTCLNYGCIATKALIRSAEVLDTVKNANDFGVKATGAELDLEAVIKRKDNVVKMLREGVEGLLSANQITLYNSTGYVKDARTVEVRDSSGKNLDLITDKLIIATGSVTTIPNIPGVDLPGVITSKEILGITDLPEEVCIVGGGVIGLEFAYILNAFGVKVTVLELLPEILPKADRELVTYLLDSFREKGINIITKAQVNAIEEDEPGMAVSFYHNDEEKTLKTGLVLMAVGREPNLAGLDALNLKRGTEKGITVNSSMETVMPGVYAIGDVTGGIQLAHVATTQGMVAAENALGEKAEFNSRSVPFCLYSKPEMAWVGLTEEEAKEKYGQIKVGRFPFTGSGKAMVHGDTAGLVKLIIDDQYGEIVGLHIIGPEATNMIAEGVLAKMLEATVTELAATIHPHPTLSEVLMEAAHMTLGHGIHYV